MRATRAARSSPTRRPSPTGRPPSWWHRSHPTFAGLVGFFVGVAYVIAVPGVYAALLGLLVSDTTAQSLFPLVLVALIVPIAMLVPRKTRRFAQFMFLGIISTALVIAADGRRGDLGDGQDRRLSCFSGASQAAS